MNEDIDAINRMRAITISREYGSGGGEIASRLAKLLGWALIDHAIVERTARELGTSAEVAEAHDEYALPLSSFYGKCSTRSISIGRGLSQCSE